MSDKKWPTFNELLKRNRELEEEVEDLRAFYNNFITQCVVEDIIKHYKQLLKENKND